MKLNCWHKTSGKIYSLSGPSGVGKDTIMTHILAQNKKSILKPVALTTRAPRNHEKHKKDYYFVSHKRFLRDLQKNRLATCTKFLNNYYGFPKQPIQKAVRQGKNVLIDITIDSLAMLKQHFPEAISIFIKPPAPEIETLKARLLNRNTESLENITKRLAKAQEELAQAHQFDYQFVNHTLSEVTEKISNLMAQNNGTGSFSAGTKTAKYLKIWTWIKNKLTFS